MSKITRARPAGPDHQVLTVETKGKERDRVRKSPCPKCPWREDAVGEFPAEAFRHSAPTGYDVPGLLAGGHAPSVFACHDQGAGKIATCAGFLLSRSADHNLALRMARARGEGRDRQSQVSNPEGLALFQDYYEMAVANGVPPDDPAITPCWRAET